MGIEELLRAKREEILSSAVASGSFQAMPEQAFVCAASVYLHG